MGKNEIKLRQRPLNPGDLLRYHDYPALMKRHRRSRRLKRAVRFFTFSLIVTIIVLLLLMIISYLWFGVEEKSEQIKENHNGTTTTLTL